MDGLLLREREVAGCGICLAVVCDGVGSLTEGGYASSAALHWISNWFDEIENVCGLGLRLRSQVLAVNGDIIAAAREQGLQTATTLSAILLIDEKYYVVHAGDSRIYMYNGKTLQQLTPDHCANGKLTSCIGRKEEIELFYGEGDYQGDLILLCSDGLYKKMDEKYMLAELKRMRVKRLRRTLERLAQHVIQCGETDNISLAIVIGGNGGVMK